MKCSSSWISRRTCLIAILSNLCAKSCSDFSAELHRGKLPSLIDLECYLMKSVFALDPKQLGKCELDKQPPMPSDGIHLWLSLAIRLSKRFHQSGCESIVFYERYIPVLEGANLMLHVPPSLALFNLCTHAHRKWTNWKRKGTWHMFNLINWIYLHRNWRSSPNRICHECRRSSVGVWLHYNRFHLGSGNFFCSAIDPKILICVCSTQTRE